MPVLGLALRVAGMVVLSFAIALVVLRLGFGP